MWLYLILNFVIIILPFLLSFDKKVRYWKKWGPFFGSFLIVGTAFIVWDIYATAEGHWSFNEDYLVGVKLFGLPIEEMMFFFTVPYACLFTYEALGKYSKQWDVKVWNWPFYVVGALSFLMGVLFWEQGYTFIVLTETGIMMILLPVVAPELIRKRRFWLFTLVTIGLFITFNMVLTAIPVVRYGPEHIWGGDGLFNGRFFTIPLEDFFYNFSMLTWYLLAYLLIIRCIKRRKGISSEE